MYEAHTPIIVLDGTYKGRTGEVVEHEEGSRTARCVLVRSDGWGADTMTLPISHFISRFDPQAGSYEALFRREGIL